MFGKKIWIYFLLSSFLFSDLSIGKMEAMVSKIKAKRVGAEQEKSMHFVSPFVAIQKEQNKKVIEETSNVEIAFTLGGIVNNKAFINKHWVALDEEIEGYRLLKIEANSVMLIQDNHRIQYF